MTFLFNPLLNRQRVPSLVLSLLEIQSPCVLLLADGQTCNDRIHPHPRQQQQQQQQQASIYCSSCWTYTDGGVSTPFMQVELKVLTQVTGIIVQNHDAYQQGNTVRFLLSVSSIDKENSEPANLMFICRRSDRISLNTDAHRMSMAHLRRASTATGTKNSIGCSVSLPGSFTRCWLNVVVCSSIPSPTRIKHVHCVHPSLPDRFESFSSRRQPPHAQ